VRNIRLTTTGKGKLQYTISPNGQSSCSFFPSLLLRRVGLAHLPITVEVSVDKLTWSQCI